MEKTISYKQMQHVQSVAKAIDPLLSKINKLQDKIEALREESDAYQEQVKALEVGIYKNLGLHVWDLVKKVVEPVGYNEKTGSPIKITKFLPLSEVKYDSKTKQFTVIMPEYGNDFDQDKAISQ